MSLNNKIPRTPEIIPIIKAPKEYWERVLPKLFEAEAGITNIATVKRPPTIFTSKATIKAIEAR